MRCLVPALVLGVVCQAALAETPATSAPPKFELDIQPIFTVAGCNSGPCHGKSRGQNGFALSLFAFDHNFDYSAVVHEARGRRVFPAAVEESLLLQKASAQMPHGGGVRLAVGSEHYETLRRWIEGGMLRVDGSDPTLASIELNEAEALLAPGQSYPLKVTATYSDGSRRDVTSLAAYQSSESAVIGVNAEGVVQAGKIPGEATIMARYMGMIATFDAAIPASGQVDAGLFSQLPRENFIDELVWSRLQRLNTPPSPPASDEKIVRRLYLDIIGRLPTPDETRRYLADHGLDKRQRLVDQLLERSEYADYWANKWADLLRPNPYRVGIKATLSLDTWLRDAFRQNMPYDVFVRELLTAQGSTFRHGPATLFRDRRSPDELVTITSQLFLGIRLECAKCHQHPFEVWGQADFYGLSAYFARVGRKGRGVSPPISGSEEMVFTATRGSVSHPLTGEEMEPRPLFGTAPEIAADADPREALFAWMVSDENPYFARVAVNRVWADLMGVGLVEPVDDLRATNPPTNPELLDTLANEFRRQKFDLKQLIRTITTSHVYGLSTAPNEHNAGDTRNYSRHYRQRLRAEVLLDAVCDITGVPESYAAMPPGSRATELWTHRVGSDFLDAFGRPDANQDPPCERTDETTMVQTLHMMNSPGLHAKVSADKGRVSQLAASDRSAGELVDELYLLTYSRLPDEEERAFAIPLVEQDRRKGLEDLLWALLNTPEFLFKD